MGSSHPTDHWLLQTESRHSGAIILVGMSFTTSSMLITTPDDTVVVHGIHYMNNLGLFLFKTLSLSELRSI